MQRVRLAVRENTLSDRTRITEADYIAAQETLGRTWVVEADGEIVAFATGYKAGSVWALFVQPGHEGRGYGNALHSTLIHWLWSLGHTRLWLTTEPGTRAERFYRARGWQPRGTASSGELRLELRANAAVSTERLLSTNPRKVFAAFEQPDRLAQWWGPSGFTNTFEQFEFRPGGRWVFVMHGPNGASYPNASVFREIQPDSRIVLEHVVEPWFRLTVTLTPRGDKTHLAWVQEFASPEVAAKMRRLTGTANEQNLDRLQSLLAGESA